MPQHGYVLLLARLKNTRNFRKQNSFQHTATVHEVSHIQEREKDAAASQHYSTRCNYDYDDEMMLMKTENGDDDEKETHKTQRERERNNEMCVKNTEPRN